MKKQAGARNVPFEIFRYAVTATSYLISSLSESELKRVRNVLLFGSTARLSATEKSDIDIFFDVSAPKRFQLALRTKLNKSCGQFYLSNTALEFKSKGVDNELSIRAGKLEEWKDLSRSISSHGIVLYSTYTAKPPDTKAYTILSWETPGKSKGALLNKIYGYKANNRHYPGLLEKAKGMKLGKAVIMVPAQSRDILTGVLEKYGVNYSRYDVWG